jgi:hypothetical protein
VQHIWLSDEVCQKERKGDKKEEGERERERVKSDKKGSEKRPRESISLEG